MDRSKLVLVPTDFTRESFAALEYAVYYANRTDAQIHLLHIAEKKELRSKVEDVAAYRNRITDLEQQLKAFKNRSGGAFRITERLVITEKSAADEILHYNTTATIEVCCIGTSGSSHSALGANTGRIVREASFPVMTCRYSKHPIQFKNLLLPIDLSRHTNEKVERILRFAQEFHCHIHLLAVSEFLEELTFSKKELLERLEASAQYFKAAGLRCSTEIIRHDLVSHSVVAYATEIKADALVVMAEHKSIITSMLLGDRTNKVVATSPIPVISFRPLH